jgi:hypothetical protein
MTRRVASMLTCTAALLLGPGLANADAGRGPAQGSPQGHASDTAAAPAFVYAVPCESKQTFIDELARLRDGEPVERALDHNGMAVSIAETEPGRWVLTLERRTAWGTDVRVVREASCEELASAARVVLSVWLREVGPPPPSAATTASDPAPPPPPKAATSPARQPPFAAARAQPSDGIRNATRVFGVSMILESASHLYVAPAAGVTAEFWTMRDARRISIAASYWTSLDEWAGNTDPTTHLRAWDASLQIGLFGLRTGTLDLGITGSLALGYVRAEGFDDGVPVVLNEFYLRPTAAGVLLWTISPSFRLRALVGLTLLDHVLATNEADWPSLYAAVGVDLEL